MNESENENEEFYNLLDTKLIGPLNGFCMQYGEQILAGQLEQSTANGFLQTPVHPRAPPLGTPALIQQTALGSAANTVVILLNSLSEQFQVLSNMCPACKSENEKMRVSYFTCCVSLGLENIISSIFYTIFQNQIYDGESSLPQQNSDSFLSALKAMPLDTCLLPITEKVISQTITELYAHFFDLFTIFPFSSLYPLSHNLLNLILDYACYLFISHICT